MRLSKSGLAKLWNISRDLQSAYNGIGVTGQTDIDIDRIAAADEPAAATISNEPFDLTEQHAYVAVALNPKLKEMDWQAVEQATSELISRIDASPKAGVMVDLSRMDYINSGLVASLVRIWKAAQQKKGQFSLVSPNEFVTEVLQSSGLWNLWTVVDSREEAVYELGASTAAKTEMRERRVLVMVSLPCGHSGFAGHITDAVQPRRDHGRQRSIDVSAAGGSRTGDGCHLDAERHGHTAAAVRGFRPCWRCSYCRPCGLRKTQSPSDRWRRNEISTATTITRIPRASRCLKTPLARHQTKRDRMRIQPPERRLTAPIRQTMRRPQPTPIRPQRRHALRGHRRRHLPTHLPGSRLSAGLSPRSSSAPPTQSSTWINQRQNPRSLLAPRMRPLRQSCLNC